MPPRPVRIGPPIALTVPRLASIPFPLGRPSTSAICPSRGAFEFEHRQVGPGIAARHFCRELRAVGKHHFNIFLALHNVVRGQDQVGGVGDPAGRHAPARVHQDGRPAGFFCGIRQGIRKFYQYILSHHKAPFPVWSV
jgi:hypothetical protein